MLVVGSVLVLYMGGNVCPKKVKVSNYHHQRRTYKELQNLQGSGIFVRLCVRYGYVHSMMSVNVAYLVPMVEHGFKVT